MQDLIENALNTLTEEVVTAAQQVSQEVFQNYGSVLWPTSC